MAIKEGREMVVNNSFESARSNTAWRERRELPSDLVTITEKPRPGHLRDRFEEIHDMLGLPTEAQRHATAPAKKYVRLLNSWDEIDAAILNVFGPQADGKGVSAQILDDIGAILKAADPQTRSISHGPDFASVTWFGTRYTFTGSQRAMVASLWEAWESGNPEVSKAYLEEQADVERVIDIFGDHPAWGTMIVNGSRKDTYRLAEPAYGKSK